MRTTTEKIQWHNGETARVLGNKNEASTEPQADPAGVLGDESDDEAVGGNEAPNDEIAGVLEENEDDTGVSHNGIE
jgi:hypothetical protein